MLCYLLQRRKRFYELSSRSERSSDVAYHTFKPPPYGISLLPSPYRLPTPDIEFGEALLSAILTASVILVGLSVQQLVGLWIHDMRCKLEGFIHR